MYWTTITMIRRKMNPRNRNRYAGFDPMDARNPTICSQMLAISLRDGHVVVPAAEVLSETESGVEDKPGQLAVHEEMIEPLHMLAPRPPRHPHVPNPGPLRFFWRDLPFWNRGWSKAHTMRGHPPASRA